MVEETRLDIHAYLHRKTRIETLRFLTCGSVDDGKSTLTGRLLHDSKAIYEDQLAAACAASKVAPGDGLDMALLVDGLQAEREQGITIDVAYRYFSTLKRKFVIADTPGHEQYTRNMVTGASHCDAAVILIDACKGILPQTKRHSFILSLLGIRHLIVAVNKMDLISYQEAVFDKVRNDYLEFAAGLDVDDIHFIPLAALYGDNVVVPTENMPWYRGSTLMHLLETMHISSDRNLHDFRFPVQYVIRNAAGFRGYAGTIASGKITVGDTLVSLPSGQVAKLQSLVVYCGELHSAWTPMAVALTLDRDIDLGRGDLLVKIDNVPEVRNRFDAMLVWMSEEPLVLGRSYLLKHGTRQVPATVSRLAYRLNIESLEYEAATSLEFNAIARAEIDLDQGLPIEPYALNHACGSFVLIDRISNQTAAAGMTLAGKSYEQRNSRATESADLFQSDKSGRSRIGSKARETRLGHGAATVLFTGMAGTGKSALTVAVEEALFRRGVMAGIIDEGVMYEGICRDLSASHGTELLHRSLEMAYELNKIGLLALCNNASPPNLAHRLARKRILAGRLLLVHLETPADFRRDGAAFGSSETAGNENSKAAPEGVSHIDLRLSMDRLGVDACRTAVLALLEQRAFIPRNG